MPTPRFTDITGYCYDEATDGYLTCTVTHPSEISIASQNLTIPVDDVKFSNLSPADTMSHVLNRLFTKCTGLEGRYDAYRILWIPNPETEPGYTGRISHIVRGQAPSSTSAAPLEPDDSLGAYMTPEQSQDREPGIFKIVRSLGLTADRKIVLSSLPAPSEGEKGVLPDNLIRPQWDGTWMTAKGLKWWAGETDEQYAHDPEIATTAITEDMFAIEPQEVDFGDLPWNFDA